MTPKVYYVNKLFGGFANGRRIDAPADFPWQFSIARLGRAGWYGENDTLPVTVQCNDVMYLRRELGGPDKSLYRFYAAACLSNEEAYDRFMRYFRTATKAVEIV